MVENKRFLPCDQTKPYNLRITFLSFLFEAAINLALISIIDKLTGQIRTEYLSINTPKIIPNASRRGEGTKFIILHFYFSCH